MKFRICREVRTRAGVRLDDVPAPAFGSNALTVHAADAEAALTNARAVVADTRNLVAIPSEN